MGTAGDAGLIIGVDTHLDTHAVAGCDERGRVESQLQVPATSAGYEQLLDWARAAASGRSLTWAIEGTRHYGLGLARYLNSQGQQVAVGRRRAGKSDPIDAVRAARELLARPHAGQMRAGGGREALRLLIIDRAREGVARGRAACRGPVRWARRLPARCGSCARPTVGRGEKGAQERRRGRVYSRNNGPCN